MASIHGDGEMMCVPKGGASARATVRNGSSRRQGGAAARLQSAASAALAAFRRGGTGSRAWRSAHARTLSPRLTPGRYLTFSWVSLMTWHSMRPSSSCSSCTHMRTCVRRHTSTGGERRKKTECQILCSSEGHGNAQVHPGRQWGSCGRRLQGRRGLQANRGCKLGRGLRWHAQQANEGHQPARVGGQS